MIYEHIIKQSPEERMVYTLKQINYNQELWILVDDDGCVFLSDEDEDCVPIWPHSELALLWATGEWQDCKAKALPLSTWYAKWTNGLLSDDVNVSVCPNPNEVGVILFADEFEHELRSRS